MDGLKGEMSVFNDKKDRRKKTKNGSRGTQRPGLNCEFVEYFWGDVWEVFGGIDLFHLMVVHSGCYFLEAAGNFHIQTYSFISPMGVKVPFFFIINKLSSILADTDVLLNASVYNILRW